MVGVEVVAEAGVEAGVEAGTEAGTEAGAEARADSGGDNRRRRPRELPGRGLLRRWARRGSPAAEPNSLAESAPPDGPDGPDAPLDLPPPTQPDGTPLNEAQGAAEAAAVGPAPSDGPREGGDPTMMNPVRGGWACPACTFVNEAGVPACSTCGGALQAGNRAADPAFLPKEGFEEPPTSEASASEATASEAPKAPEAGRLAAELAAELEFAEGEADRYRVLYLEQKIQLEQARSVIQQTLRQISELRTAKSGAPLARKRIDL